MSCIIYTYRGDQTDNLIMSSIYKTVRGLNTNIRKTNHLHAKARYMYSIAEVGTDTPEVFLQTH